MSHFWVIANSITLLQSSLELQTLDCPAHSLASFNNHKLKCSKLSFQSQVHPTLHSPPPSLSVLEYSVINNYKFAVPLIKILGIILEDSCTLTLQSVKHIFRIWPVLTAIMLVLSIILSCKDYCSSLLTTPPSPPSALLIYAQ